MKTLIDTIATALKNAESLSYITDTNIFVTPDADIIPYSCSFPALGIKDGPIEYRPLTNIRREVTYNVDVIIYVKLTEGETPITGQTTPRIYGVLEIASDIDGLLSENYLSITGMEQAWLVNEQASRTIGYDELVLQQKIMTFQYTKQEDRP